MTYDIESNLISIELAKGKIANAHRLGKFIIHLSSAGKPILLEILEAGKFIGSIDKTKNLEQIITANQF